ncbi:hypothetical protein F5884DRAFT_226684 [Xylogone sp. PMI_703]|nr:hypothetical protein F5884DRAFT_226684 [Xylogone sp. PMI_703]
MNQQRKSSHGTEIKRRAKGACEHCRHRKLKCDMMTRGIPCSNCTRGEHECKFLESKRRSKYRRNEDRPPQRHVHGDESDLSDEPFPSQHNKSRYNPLTDSTMQDILPGWDLDTLYSIAALPPVDKRPSDWLPPYIRPLPGHILDEDIMYLDMKGVFKIPSLAIVKKFLRSYILWVHPMCPIIDLHQLLSSILEEDDQKISLLLFHAVGFAASAFVEMECLTSLGFKSRVEARRSLFQQARLLYDFDADDDRFSVVQALILMSYWYESDNSQKDTWFWSSLSFSMAQALGFPAVSNEVVSPIHLGSDPRRNRLWKRMLWSSFCRRAIAALGMRRHLKREMTEWDLPDLCIDDFDLEPLPSHLVESLGDCSCLESGEYYKEIAIMCLAKNTLCQHLTEILECQFSDEARRGEVMETTMILAPIPSSSEKISQYDAVLSSWLADLPSWLVYDIVVDDGLSNNRVIRLHAAFLKLLYFTTLITLHRPNIRQCSSPPSSGSHDSSTLSWYKTEIATDEITRVVSWLQQFNLTRFLPLTAVTALLTAAFCSLQQTTALDDNLRVSSGTRLYYCTVVLQSLKDVHVAASIILSILSRSIARREFKWCREYLNDVGSPITNLS